MFSAVAEAPQEARPPVVAQARREEHVRHVLRYGVRHGLDQVDERSSKVPQRPHDLLASRDRTGVTTMMQTGTPMTQAS